MQRWITWTVPFQKIHPLITEHPSDPDALGPPLDAWESDMMKHASKHAAAYVAACESAAPLEKEIGMLNTKLQEVTEKR